MRGLAISIGIGFFVFAVSASAQSTVSTSGTTSAGTIPIFTGTSTIGNSIINELNGYVGIWTTSPQSAISVAQPWPYGEIAIYGYSLSDVFGFQVDNSAHSGNDYRLEQGRYGNGTLSINDCSNHCAGRLTVLANGNLGIGTTTPSAVLEVDGNVKLTSNSGASITFQDGTIQSTAYTGVSCGGDFAESVDVTGDRTKYGPGDVLVIDPDHPGNFLKSVEPYSTAVTGIYSTRPGSVGRRQLTPQSSEEVPMAMIGIVPTKVTAENGPIHAGDLLVTSSMIGYAMRGTDRSRLTGAVIGKALGNLNTGTGVIEMVVTLQ